MSSSPRTLVVSDLHIGARDGRSVVERPAALELLLGGIDACERLVLLGDLVELKDSDPGRSLRIAEPILRAIGQRAGVDRQIIFLPGNHDRGLVAGWVRWQGPNLQREAIVPADASHILSAIVAQLGPAMVEVRYPGVWLTDQVWAHHGHYLNRYLSPEQGFGLLLRNAPKRRAEPAAVSDPLVAPGPAAGAAAPAAASITAEDQHEGLLRPFDFEPGQRLRLPIARRPSAPDHALQMARPWHAQLHDRLLPTRASRLVAPILGRQMRHHTLPAMARAATDLGVTPEYLLFGHVHRRGPMAGDWLQEWRFGETELLNTGAWRLEPVLVSDIEPPHPYWPGGAIWIERDGVPHSVGLLDELDFAELSPPADRDSAIDH